MSDNEDTGENVDVLVRYRLRPDGPLVGVGSRGKIRIRGGSDRSGQETWLNYEDWVLMNEFVVATVRKLEAFETAVGEFKG